MKKQSKYLNTAFLLASGGLIVYVISQFMKKKKEATSEQTTSSNSNLNLGSANMPTFDETFAWLKAQEGEPSRVAVKDGKDKNGNQLYSIGLGHQIQPNEPDLMFKRLSDQEILDIFKKDIAAINKSLNKVIKVPLNKNQRLALLSLRYNIGESAFNDSTLLKFVNAGNFTGAALRFAEWRMSEGKVLQGLVNRRERERNLFSTPVGNPIIGTIPSNVPKSTKPNINYSVPFTIPKLD